MKPPVSPIDSDEAITLIREIQASALIEAWQQQFAVDITQELQGVAAIQLFEGEQSRLQFFHPPELAGSGWLYEQLQRFPWFYMPDRWEHRMALQHLRGCRQVLEIGSGSGAFLRAALDQGISIQGIEINKKSAARAQAEGLPVQYADLSSGFTAGDGQFDAVCGFQVLEHLAQPGLFLEAAVRWLQPGGLLIVSVPNADSCINNQENLLDMPPHHMTRWRAETFKRLEAYFPLQLKTMEREPLAVYHVRYWLQTCSKRLRLAALNPVTIPFLSRILCASERLRSLCTGHCLIAHFVRR